jgi:hypothetical protein
MIQDIKDLTSHVGKISATIDQALASSQKQVTDLTVALETDRQAYALARADLATAKALVASQGAEIATLKATIETQASDAAALAAATAASAAKVDSTVSVRAAAITATQGVPPLAIKPDAAPAGNGQAPSKLKGREKLSAAIETQLAAL